MDLFRILLSNKKQDDQKAAPAGKKPAARRKPGPRASSQDLDKKKRELAALEAQFDEKCEDCGGERTKKRGIPGRIGRPVLCREA